MLHPKIISKLTLKYAISFCLTLLIISELPAQVQNVQYGKNREQFHDDQDQWFYYESDNLLSYWYGKSQRTGQIVVKIAENEYRKIIDVLEHPPRKKVQLFVFSDLTDMNQSNIGIDDVLLSTQDDVKTVGKKVFIYFDEDYEQLKRQIREGISRVIINDIYNPSILEASLNQEQDYDVPQWFHQGLAAYVGQNWSQKEDVELKRYVQKKKKLKFKKLARDNPRLAGHAFWYFLETNFNRKLISNIVYLTKINPDLDDTFFYLLGVRTKDVIAQWENYYSQFYKNEFGKFQEDSVHTIFESKRLMTEVIPTDRNELIYIENKRGRKKAKLLNLDDGKRSKIFKKGYVNFLQKTDYNYLQLRVDTIAQRAGMLYEFRDQIIFRLYDLANGGYAEQVLPERYERVNSFDFFSGDTIVMSALANGAYDLFKYNLNNRQGSSITSDVFVEKDVAYAEIGGKRGVIFTSDRNQSNLNKNYDINRMKRINTFDVYFLEIGGQPVLYRITNTPGYDEIRPQITGDKLYFLSDANGIRNIYERDIDFTIGGTKYWLDSRTDIYEVDPDTIDRAVTLERIYKTNDMSVSLGAVNAVTQELLPIMDYAIRGSNELITVSKAKKKYQINSRPIGFEQFGYSTFIEQDIRRARLDTISPTIPKVNLNDNFISTRWSDFTSLDDLTNYLEKKEEKQLELDPIAEQVELTDDTLANVDIEASKITAYRTQFTNFGFNTSLNNQPLFGGLDAYSANLNSGTDANGNAIEPEYDYQPITIMPRLTIKDLLENHVIDVGFRIPGSLDGTEVFARYEDRRKQLDKYYVFYRRSQTRNIRQANTIGNNDVRSRTRTLIGQFGVKYPLDVFNSIGARATIRTDNVQMLSSDQRSLIDPDAKGNRIGLGLEYIFDNAMTILPNIYRGSRMKVYIEGTQTFTLSLRDPVEFGIDDQFMTVIGTDLRHYINFLKYSVVALRLAGETSFGNQNILYYLGGADNWLLPEFDQTLVRPSGRDYAFTTTAPNLRGFNTNVRNGSTYALINAEVRLPVFNYLGFANSKFKLLKNFQAIGFFDIGSAWDGINPFDDDNPLNTEVIEQGPIRVVARYDRDPIVYGYGFGIRSTLFGYFIRADWAWGVDTGIRQDSIFYLSLGYDF